MAQRDQDKSSLRSGPLEEWKQSKKPDDYLRTVRQKLRDGKAKEAYAVLLKAVAEHPDDPFLLSYFGSLQAIVDKKFKSGIAACTRAILLLKKESFSEAAPYAAAYLNLGRACLAAGDKKDALMAFKKGLRYDAGHRELNEELQRLGVRKKPPVSFLDRSHPVNRIIGKMLHRTGKKSR